MGELLSGQSKLCCPRPSCKRSEDEAVEDYTVPGRIEPSSKVKDVCGWCGGQFTVERVADDSYQVLSV